MDRRRFLTAAGLGCAAMTLPTLSFASASTEKRLVLVILRGAMDGLALAAPYADPDYTRLRGELALAAPGGEGGTLPLDGTFGLHPAFETLHSLYRDGEAAVVHAVASPYRERSHFDGQDILENGGSSVGLLRDGWLNRALEPLGGSLGDERAIALAQNTPLILRGENSVMSWAPSRLPHASDSTLDRLADLYADDEFFATRLTQAMSSQEIAEGADSMQSRQRGDAAALRSAAASAARFLTTDGGPSIAVVEVGGWDTHANQGSSNGQLANRFAALDGGLLELKRELGETWSNTVVAVVTEFGRTVRVNGTRGTDHGTGTAAVLTGGAVDGGRVITDWPGLKNLHEDRDLRPTADIRSMFKAVLHDHMNLPSAFVDNEVFPDSRDARPMRDLIST
ncbi:MAG: DUF1501 domain-containing protein [Woeseiaceae bacterium]|nr:DUF1501 domain-containing protein [Woeseiaceae bacterium]